MRPIAGPARRTGTVPALLLLLTIPPALADEAGVGAPAAPASGIVLRGLVDVHHAWNAKRVDPALRSSHPRHDSFTLCQTDVALACPAGPDRRTGFRVAPDFGDAADAVAATEPTAAARSEPERRR